ncbi:MAG: hypothetical protein AABY15_01715 [Nanoarchaeota archaeon]
MSITVIVTLSVLGFLLLMCFIGIIYGFPWLVQEYPKEWEKQEDEELLKKFKDYEKSQK